MDCSCFVRPHEPHLSSSSTAHPGGYIPRCVVSVPSKSLPHSGQHEFPNAASDHEPHALQRKKVFANGSRSYFVRMCLNRRICLNRFIAFPFVRCLLLVSDGIPQPCRSSYRKNLVNGSTLVATLRTLPTPSQKPSQKPEP